MGTATGEVRTEVLRHLGPDRVRDVTDVVAAATDADGVRPLNEHVMLHLRYGGDAEVRHVLRFDGDTLVGYGHLDVTDPVEGSSGEVVVHPQHRHRRHGRAVVTALVEASPNRAVRLWAHGGHSDAARLAEGMGFTRSRTLWQMRRSLATPLPKPQLPDWLTLRTFRPGADDAAWVALNALAFADHPEQGSITLEDLHQRMAQPWFDPAGFFLGTDADGALVGFHWTKVHGGNESSGSTVDGDAPASGAERQTHGHDPVGEVYVVGVHPDVQGAGLGRALTLVGLRHLRSLGLSYAVLYVEADNDAAIRVYTSLGFTHEDTDVMYRFVRPG